MQENINLSRDADALNAAFAHEGCPVCTVVLERMQRFLDEVQELVRKHDYRFSNEPQGEEMSSWRRAALLLVGNPGAR